MKLWQKRLVTVVGVIVVMYLMIFIRVRTEASREYREASQHYEWWKHPEDKRNAMMKELSQRTAPSEPALTEAERREKVMQLVAMQREKKPLEKQQALRQELARIYFVAPDALKVDGEALAAQGRIQVSEKESLVRDLGDIYEMSYDIERFKREMTEYYWKHPETVDVDLTALLNDKKIAKAEHKWLLRELKDIKEVFESDIKTAYYGYCTVLDIWLDPPAWPPSVLRNSALANDTRQLIGTRDEREEARQTGTSTYTVTQEFEGWVRDVTPPVSGSLKAAPAKPGPSRSAPPKPKKS